MQTYQQLVEYVKHPVPDYYEMLLKHADVIITQSRIHNQTKMAQDLRMTQPKLSIVLHMLAAYSRLLHQQIVNSLEELSTPHLPQLPQLPQLPSATRTNHNTCTTIVGTKTKDGTDPLCETL